MKLHAKSVFQILRFFIYFYENNVRMPFTDRQNNIRWSIIIVSLGVIMLILWNTYRFFQVFKEDERIKMEWWAEAQKTLLSVEDIENTDISLPYAIIVNNSTIPIIMTDAQGGIIETANVPEEWLDDKKKMQSLLQKLSKENDPIEVQWNPETLRYLYYGNSSLLNQLKYYPIALLLIILLFVLLIYNYYQSNKFATENKLWAGMAKETAHQIGTPLSSLMGWVEIMKSENADTQMVSEIEKDLLRLQMITDRFSKIGSEPILEVMDVTASSRQSFDYLKSRFSKQVSFEFHAPDKPLYSKINPILHSWTIENLVKNAVDAMKGKGSLEVHIVEIDDWIKIYVIDTGKGIPKNEFKKIFEPGFTTKKRGWGLGLSLTKRIVEDYHKGKIAIDRSEVGKGTSLVVSLKQFEATKI